MPVSESYLTFVVDQLNCIGEVTARRMFGGAMLSHNEKPFALIADDVLYFKVDDSNRPDYEAAGMGPFKPFTKKSYVMQYYEVPIEILEDPEKLTVWADKSLSASKRKPFRSKKKKQN